MRTIIVIAAVLILTVASLTLAYATCPTTVFCNMHRKEATWTSIEHVKGKCFCVYTHVGPTHRLVFECDEGY